jgi:hypothetical protein
VLQQHPGDEQVVDGAPGRLVNNDMID